MITQITCTELKDKLAKGEPLLLVDVREQWEHDSFNIGGRHIPLAEVTAHAQELPQDIPVIMYCKKGVRSQVAIQRLQQKLPFLNLVNLQGGIEAWKKMMQ